MNCVRADGYVSHPYCCRRVCHEVEIDRYRHYIWCLECGHPYRTRWHLWLAYAWRFGHIWRIPRPSRISFCQCCSHDF